MLFRNYLTSTYFHWDFFCGWCLFKYFKLCYSPAILKVLFIFWINVTQPVACFVFPKSEESQRKSCHVDTVYLLSFNRACFVFHVQNLFAYLQVAKNVLLHFILQLLESLHSMFDLYWFDCCIHGKLESNTFSFLFSYGYSS